jgi:hypothetical protein
MVEGRPASDAMLVMLVLLATVAGLGWNVMRASPGGRRRLWLIALGVVVGIAAASRVWPLNAQEPGAALITAYDLWWPPLAIWMAVCIADIVMLVLGIGAVAVRLLAVLGAVGVVAVAASQQPVPADLHSAAGVTSRSSACRWRCCRPPGAPCSTVTGVKAASRSPSVPQGRVSMAFAKVRAAAMLAATSTWTGLMLGVIGVVVVLAALMGGRRRPRPRCRRLRGAGRRGGLRAGPGAPCCRLMPAVVAAAGIGAGGMARHERRVVRGRSARPPRRLAGPPLGPRLPARGSWGRQMAPPGRRAQSGDLVSVPDMGRVGGARRPRA